MPYADPDKRRAYGREWIRRNGEKAREAMRRWRERHPDEHRAENAAYYARNAERLNKRIAEYHRANPAVVRAKSQRHRALRKGAEGAFTPQQWKDLVAVHGGRCAYCRCDVPLEPDHRVALSRGGSNRIDNILPACRRCNARKHRMSEAEFRARLAAEQDQQPPYN
ncbi:MAG: HNH endonuclease signature motif containing protein [Chloroflexota bacterium]